jgi:hypothetical protein
LVLGGDLLVALELKGKDGVEGVEGEAFGGTVGAGAARRAQISVRAQGLGTNIPVQAVGEGVRGGARVRPTPGPLLSEEGGARKAVGGDIE